MSMALAAMSPSLAGTASLAVEDAVTPVLEDLKARLRSAVEERLQARLEELDRRERAVELRERELEARERRLEQREAAQQAPGSRQPARAAPAPAAPTPAPACPDAHPGAEAAAAASLGIQALIRKHGGQPEPTDSALAATAARAGAQCPRAPPAAAPAAGGPALRRLQQESSVSLFCPEEDTGAPSATGTRSPSGTAVGADSAPPPAAAGNARRSLFDCAEEADATVPALAESSNARESPEPCEVHSLVHSVSLPASQMKHVFEEKAAAAKRSSLSPGSRRRKTWTPKSHKLPLPSGEGSSTFRAHDAPYQPKTTLGAPPREKRSLADLLKQDEQKACA